MLLICLILCVDKLCERTVYYRMPYEKEIWFLQSEGDVVAVDALNNVPGGSGFILHPFTSDGSSNPYFFKADKRR